MASDLPTTLRTLAATPEAVTVEAAQVLLTIADRVEAMEGELAALREAAGDSDSLRVRQMPQPAGGMG